MRPSQSVIRWGEVLKRTGCAIYQDDCLGWAGELAFFWFLALFPALLFVVALAGSLPVQHLIDVVVGSLARVAPGDVLVLVREQLVQIAQGPPRGLLTLSLLGALWSSSSAMTAIIDTLNQAYHVREGRSWWRVRLLAVGLTVVLFAFTLIAVAFVMIGPTLAETTAACKQVTASLSGERSIDPVLSRDVAPAGLFSQVRSLRSPRFLEAKVTSRT